MKNLCLVFLFLAFHQCVKAQSREKIHVHFDKQLYLPGETVWFKAYLFNGSKPSTLSTNFYAAIYDENGTLIQEKQYPIFDGSSIGDFSLPDTLSSDKIQFVAFTRGLRSVDSNNLYKEVLAVYHKKAAGVQNVISNDKTVLQFFTEGGKAIAGLPNYISFRAWRSNGDPAIIKGVIVEEGTNVEIDSFYTNDIGVGILQLTPEVNKTYKAVWNDESGNSQETAMPAFSRYGVSFHAEQSGKTLFYIISGNAAAENFDTVKLVGKMGNEEVYRAVMVLKNTLKLVHQLPLDSFNNGLLHLSLLDNYNNTLQVRTILVNHPEPEIKINHIERSITAKGKNVIEIQIPDTALYNLSASISDINFYEKRPGIEEGLWFNNATGGPRYDLDALLRNADDKKLDLLLQTGAAHQYSYPGLKLIKDDYLGLTVNYKEKKYALPKDEELVLMINDNTTEKQFYNIPATSQTSFTKTGLFFYDTAKVYYKLKHSTEIGSYISIQRESQMAMPRKLSPLENAQYVFQKRQAQEADTLMEIFNAPRLKKFNELQTIRGITVKSKYRNPETKRIVELDDKYATGMFKGIARGYQLNVIDDEKAWASSDICSYIAYKIPGLLVLSTSGERNLYAISRETRSPVKIAVFVNETEYPEQIGVGNISMTEVAYIKYINGIVIGSSFTTSEGVLYIYTRKGDELVTKLPFGMNSVLIKGYDLAKEYSTPDYSDKAEAAKADYRSTVYWNPYIAYNPGNKIRIEYFNNDISKKLLLTIEGFNAEGKLIHIEKLIEN